MKTTIGILLIGAVGIAPITGCEALPGDEKTQGAVIGGLGGAVAGGAVAGRHDRLLGALIGGAVGAGGGYLIGSEVGKSDRKRHHSDALAANRAAEERPATVDDARRSRTTDINGDGYVTMDEVVAVSRTGISEDEQLDRLRRTNQFFELTGDQEQYLIDRGVSRRVVLAMRDLNSDQRERAYSTYRETEVRVDDRDLRDRDRPDYRDDRRYDR
jgi:hypothetical protein